MEGCHAHAPTRVLSRALAVVLVILGTEAALLTLPGMRQLGTRLLASTGLLGLVVGAAVQSAISNLIAGV